MESVAGDRRPTGSGISRSVPGSPSREGNGAGSDHWQFRRLTATSGSARTRGATSRPAGAIPADANNTDITRAGIERVTAQNSTGSSPCTAETAPTRRPRPEATRPAAGQGHRRHRTSAGHDECAGGEPGVRPRQPDLRSNHAPGRSRELHARRPSGVRLPRKGSCAAPDRGCRCTDRGHRSQVPRAQGSAPVPVRGSRRQVPTGEFYAGQRVPPYAPRRRIHREGLPDLGSHASSGPIARAYRHAQSVYGAGGSGGHQRGGAAGCAGPAQHARCMQALLHLPDGFRRLAGGQAPRYMVRTSSVDANARSTACGTM